METKIRTGRKPKAPGESEGCKMLFEWVQERGLTYTDASALLGYPIESLSRYITGARKPEPKAMYRFKTLADIPMEAWMEITEPTSSP